jgi:hypothetical protein
MKIFKKRETDIIDLEKVVTPIVDIVPEPEPEQWIWVEGYKGTNKDMKCLDFQYELGVQYDMPDDKPIEECKSGFHLCLKLQDVYSYYNIGDGNRFFKVKALVRKSDFDKYGDTCDTPYILNGMSFNFGFTKNKLTSKSIIFLSELTVDEIFKNVIMIHHLPSQYYQMAIDHSIDHALQTYRKNTLIEDGYSEAFACHIISVGKFDIAHAVGTQKDLSMDVKVLTILYQK